MTLKLTPSVDLDVYYAADSLQHSAEALALVTSEVFKRMYGSCPSVGFECDGIPIGGVIFDGKRPHIAVLPAWQGRWGPLLRPMLRWLYSQSREMVIGVSDDNKPLQRFVACCGWPAVGREAGDTLHLMTPMGARRIAQIADVIAPPEATRLAQPGEAGAAGIAASEHCVNPLV